MMPVLEKSSYLSWLEIDLEAIRHNYRFMRSRLKPGTELFAVIKADAYGHGAVPVGRAMEAEGAPVLCVARGEEALELRDGGLTAPILVLGPPLESQPRLFAGMNTAAVVSCREHIEFVAAAARTAGERLRVHLKVDVGMGRVGVRPESAVEFARTISSLPELELDGVMTHFPCADGEPRSLTEHQIRAFSEVCNQLAQSGYRPRWRHCANSAAILQFPEAHLDAARAGIVLYGINPSIDMPRHDDDLHPAMTLKSRIVLLKTVPPGTGLSYGHTFHTTRETVVATVPLGYADGYPRHASNSADMIVRGRCVPQVGRVCMDLLLLDVTDVPEVLLGDEVVAFGRAGQLTLRAEDVAARFGSIGYELTTRIGKRLQKFYE